MSQARRKRYRAYLEPNSSSECPKQTVHSQKRMADGLPLDRNVGLNLGIDGDDNEEDADTGDELGSGSEMSADSDESNILPDEGIDGEPNATDNTVDDGTASNFGDHSRGSVTSSGESSANSSASEDTNESIREDSVELEADDRLNSPLAPGLSKTKFEALILLLHYSMRFGLTNVALEALLKLVNFLLDSKAIPDTLFRVNNTFKDSDNNIVIFHFYCKSCMSYLGTKDLIELGLNVCGECNTAYNLTSMNDGNFFITLPLNCQLKSLLEKPDFFKLLKYRFERPPADDVITDIFDGLNYKSLSEQGNILADENNFSITFNTDGAPVFKSCKSSMWPIQFFINELSPKVRFNPENILLAGLWFGSKEPKMDLFLKPFVEEAVNLSTEGIKWTNPMNLQDQVSKVVTLCCCLDSVAKPMVTNTTQFNGYFGCCYCKHPGEKVLGNQVRYTVSINHDRTDQQMRHDMIEAHTTGSAVDGVKGISPLIALVHFNMVDGVIIDYMHAVLLGVTRSLSNLWFSSCNNDKEYYIGLLTKQVDTKILQLTPPQTISRSPRPISDRVHWKANEWRSWLLFYCLPCLNGILPPKYLQNLMLLVSAIFMLLQDSITYPQVDQANIFLQEFVVDFQELYGPINMTYNIHLLTHLATMVSLWGPLWAYSAFSFESGNGFLLKLINGTRGVSTQIVQKYVLYRSIPKFVKLYTVSDSTLAYCSDMVGYRRVKEVSSLDSNGIKITVFGPGKIINLTEDEDIEVARAGLDATEARVHMKIIVNGTKFHCKLYKRPKKTDDCIARLSNGNYCIIEKILKINQGVYALIRFLRLCNQCVIVPGNCSARATHLRVCSVDENTVSLQPAHMLQAKCVLICYEDHHLVCDFPNVFEKD